MPTHKKGSLQKPGITTYTDHVYIDNYNYIVEFKWFSQCIDILHTILSEMLNFEDDEQ